MISKEVIRKTVASRLQALEKEYIDEASHKINSKISQNSIFLASKTIWLVNILTCDHNILTLS